MIKPTCAILIAAVIVVVVSSCASKQDRDPVEGQPDTSVAAKPPARIGSEGVDTSRLTIADSSVTVRSDTYPMPKGRVVNVLVTGVDARLGERGGRADANHLVRFFLDSGCVEIIAIPRGTPADAGFPDTSTFNMLANVRTARGQSGYFKAVAEIAGVPKVDYWVEFGFSQALGLLELMGYRDNAQATLRVLRSRKAYATGDYQRSYNQGQFIRQVMLRTFDNTDDVLGQLAMRAALALVETNLTYDATQSILEQLRQKGFSSQSKDRVWVRVKPEEVQHFQVFDFDSTKVGEMDKQISHRVDRTIADSARVSSQNVEARLGRMVARAVADSARRPVGVMQALQRPYQQRAWMQISNRQARRMYRDRICGLMIYAYRRVGREADAKGVEQFLELDRSINAGMKAD
ncbi:MAG: LytR family transcriptional regulator [Candidatus Kapabacteria bacterium]|nr:LytR family transcriptional regulator [Candidatus Kapabacteria bacterium]